MSISNLQLVLFLALFGASLTIVLFWPGVKLPNDDSAEKFASGSVSLDHFQFFRDDHLFERWDRHEKRKFPAFDPFLSALGGDSAGFPMPIRLVWGLKPGKRREPVVFGEFSWFLMVFMEICDFFCVFYAKFDLWLADLENGKNLTANFDQKTLKMTKSYVKLWKDGEFKMGYGASLNFLRDFCSDLLVNKSLFALDGRKLVFE